MSSLSPNNSAAAESADAPVPPTGPTVSNPGDADEQSSNALEIARSILGHSIKCTLDDGRTVVGTFVCVDRLKNLILTKVVEERWIEKSDYSTKSTGKHLAKRELGQVMIPGQRLVRVEINKHLFEKTLGHDSNSTASLR